MIYTGRQECTPEECVRIVFGLFSGRRFPMVDESAVRQGRREGGALRATTISRFYRSILPARPSLIALGECAEDVACCADCVAIANEVRPCVTALQEYRQKVMRS